MPEQERRTFDSKEFFGVVVTMKISDEDGKEVDSKTVDFGNLRADQLKGLTDLFSMMASNVEYVRKLSPQYEKLGNSIPPYLR
jgi:hypothetical protein